jgi:hypothetical protein
MTGTSISMVRKVYLYSVKAGIKGLT